METSISTNADEAAEQIDQLAKETTMIVNRLAESAARQTYQEGRTYDAAPVPGYKRTGYMSLQTVWYKGSGGGYIAEMRADYSGYVRGTMTSKQAWMHEGRWKSWRAIVSDVVENIYEQMIKRFVSAKDRILK